MSLALSSACYGVYAPGQDRALGQDGAELRESIKQAVAPPPGRVDRTEDMLIRMTAALRKGSEIEGVLLGAETFGRAFEVLNSLPADVPLPEIVVESSDEIGLDWQEGSRRVLSLTVDETAYLGFAALISHETLHGRAPFAGHLPKTIADLLRRIYGG